MVPLSFFKSLLVSLIKKFKIITLLSYFHQGAVFLLYLVIFPKQGKSLLLLSYELSDYQTVLLTSVLIVLITKGNLLFSVRAPQLWNSLPEEPDLANTIPSYKSLLKTLIINIFILLVFIIFM